MSLLKPLEWRYATKKFDKTRKLSAGQLAYLEQAVRLSPSSFGLQHYKILVIDNHAVREQLRAAGNNQAQITDASHLFVLAAETNINEQYVKQYVDEIANVRHTDRDHLVAFEEAMVGAIGRMSEDQKIAWAHKQAYIALGVLLTAAADAGIDACPMEGVHVGKFDEILDLNSKGLTTSVVAAVGFRAADDDYSKYPKVRKPDQDLFIRI